MSKKLLFTLLVLLSSEYLYSESIPDTFSRYDKNEFRLYGQDVKSVYFYLNRIVESFDTPDNKDFDNLLFYAKKLEAKTPKFMAMYYYNYGKYKKAQGQYFLALENLLTTYKYLNNYYGDLSKPDNVHFRAYTLIEVANLFFTLNSLNTAKANYNEASVLFKQANEKYGIALCLNNIGLIHETNNNLDSALILYNHALALYSTLPDKDYLSAHSHIYIARIKSKQNNFSEAETYLKDAIDKLERINGNNSKQRLFEAYLILGDVYKHYGFNNNALENYYKAEKLALSYGYKNYLCSAYLNLSQFYLDKKDFTLAKEFAVKAVKIALAENFVMHKMSALLALTNIFISQGNAEQAKAYLMRYNAMRDSLNSIAMAKNLNEFNRSIKNTELQYRSERDKLLFYQNTKTTIIVSIFIIIILVLIIFYYYRINKIRISDQKRLKQFGDASLEGIVVHDNSVIVDINTPLLELVHYEREEVINRTIWDIIHPDCYENVRNIIKANEKSFYTMKIVDKYGNTRIVEVMSKPFIYNKRKMRSAALRDITDKIQMIKKLEEEEAKFRTIVDLLPMGIILMTIDSMDVLLINKLASKLLEYDPEFQNLNKFTRVKTDNFDYEGFVNAVRQNGTLKDYEIMLFNYQNDKIWFLVSAAIVNINNKDTLLVGLSDITGLKQTETELIKARENAERADKTKSEFLANMSHEIRTPMNAILGYSKILKEEIFDEKHREYLDGILISGKGLLELINDILDLSKIEAGKVVIHPEAVNISNIINEVRQIFNVKLAEKGLYFEVDIASNVPYSLFLDEIRFRQILLNLVGNAVKFTHKGGIKIRVAATNLSNDNNSLNLCVEIEDTGIGIPNDQQERIFEAFSQSQNQKAKIFGGTGLGLTISRRLLEIMNGNIYLKSEYGSGSTFKIILFDVKVSNMPATRSQTIEEEMHIRLKPCKILLAEDIENNRKVIRGFLNNSGDVIIIETVNGLECIETTKTDKPDLILMDLQMPVMDGYEAMEIIKNNPALKNIPIIALSASSVKYKEDYIDKYCSGYLKKPVSKRELLKTLSEFLPFEKVELPSDEQKLLNNLQNCPDKLREILKEKQALVSEMSNGLIVKNVLQLANEFSLLADSFNYIPLRDYAKELEYNTRTFNVEKVNTMLLTYTELMNK